MNYNQYNQYNQGSKTVSLFSQPYLDTYNQCYKNIITINLPPQGPLRQIVRKVKFNPLSPFSQSNSNSNCNRMNTCGLALQSIGNGTGIGTGVGGNCCNLGGGCNLMVVDEIPDLFSYLLSNGYTIDTKITNMLNANNIEFNANNQKTLICFITYQG